MSRYITKTTTRREFSFFFAGFRGREIASGRMRHVKKGLLDRIRSASRNSATMVRINLGGLFTRFGRVLLLPDPCAANVTTVLDKLRVI